MSKIKRLLSVLLSVAIVALSIGSCDSKVATPDISDESIKSDYSLSENNEISEAEPVADASLDTPTFDVSGDSDTIKTATITGLTPNTTYYVRVYAVDSTGNYANSGYSNVMSATTAQKLAAPTPTAVATSNETVDVSITPVANATSYAIELSSNSSFTSPQTVTTSELSAQFVGLTDNTTYYVRAKALYPDQAVYTNSDYSSNVTVKTLTKLATPTVTVDSWDLTTITVTLSNVANAGSYSIEAATSPTSTNPLVFPVTGLTNTLTGLTQGTTYYIKARALPATTSTHYRSEYSTPITQHTLKKLADPVLTFTPLGTTSINIGTPVLEGCLKTTIEYSTGAEFSDVHTIDIPAGESDVNLTGLSGGTIYYFRAKSYSSDATRFVDSEVSRIVFCETADTLPTPTFTAEAISDTAIAVNIDNIPAAGRYSVEVTPAGGTAYTVLTTSLMPTITSLTSNKAYSIRIKAISNSSKFMDSEYSSPVSVTTFTKLPAPASVTTELTTPTSISTTVAAVTNATTYVTEIATNAEFTNKVSFTGISTHTFEALQSGTTYYIRAKALTTLPNYVESNYTSVYTVTTPPDLNAPLVTATATAKDAISVTLSSVTNAASYSIEVADNSAFTSSRTITTTTLTNSVTGLVEGTVYYVRARAEYSDVAGAYSNYSSVVNVKTLYRLDAPIITVEPVSPTEISVITSATNEGGYDIEISTSSTFASVETVHTATMRTPISGLVTNTTYYVRAKAIATVVGTVNSDYSDTVTVTTPLKLSAPTLTSTALGTDELSVTISEVANATTYRLEVSDDSTFSSPTVTITNDLINTITGLSESATYYIRAKALAPSALYADSDYSNFITNTTSVKLQAPAVSAEFTGTTSISVTSYSLNADKYQIEVSKNSTFASAETVTKTTTVNAFTGLDEGTTYYVRAKALSDDYSQYVDSEYSSTIRVTTPATLVAPIITLTPVSTTSFSVQAASANASSYYIEVDTNSSFSNPRTFTSLGEITNCTEGTKYYVRVKAIGDTVKYVDSDYSVTGDVTTLIQIGKPTIALESLGTTSAKLTITEQEHVGNYRVEVSKTSNFTTPVVTLTSDLESIVGALDEDTTYYVRVRAFSNDAAYTDSVYSDAVSIKTSKQLSAPTLTAEFASTTSITVNAESSNADSYQIEISLDPEFTSPCTSTELLTTNTYSNLNEGLTYYVRAKALSDDVSVYTDSEYSQIVMVTTPVTLSAPALVVAPIDHLSFSVKALNADAAGYTIEVSTTSTFDDVETFTESGIIADRTPATTYYVRAKALGDAIHTVDSEYTEAATVTTLTKLTTTEVTATVLSNTEIQIDYDAVDNAEDYRVEVADNALFENPIIVLSNRTSVILPGLAEGTVWYARVRAMTTDPDYVSGDYSEVVSAYTPVQLATPTIAAGSLNNTELYVNIDAVENSGHYLIEVSTSPEFTVVEKIETTELENVISNRDEGTTYYVRATAVSEDVTQFVDSNVSTIATLFTHTKLLKPTFTVDYINPTQVALHIDAVQHTSTYQIDIALDDAFDDIIELTTTDTDNVISNFTPGTTYYFKVKSVTEDTGLFVDSDFSRTQELLMPIQLDVPTFDVASYTDTTVSLNIAEVENAGKYRVDYSTTADFAEYDSITSADTLATVTGLTADTQYYFRVTALTPSRVYVNSELSEVVEQTTRKKIVSPLILTEVESDTEIALFAGVVDLADSYSVEYDTDPEFTNPTIITIDTTDTLLSGLTADTIYYIRARAFDSTQEAVISDYSNLQSAKTFSEPPSVPKFDAPVMIRGYADSSSQVTFLWTPGTTAPAGYELEIAKDSTFTEKVFSKDISSNYSYYSFGELDPATTYYARIRTIGVSGRGETSNWSNVVFTATEAATRPKLSVAKILQLDTETTTSNSLTAIPYIQPLAEVENPLVEVQVSLYPDFSEVAATGLTKRETDSNVDAAMDENEDAVLLSEQLQYVQPFDFGDWDVQAGTDEAEDPLSSALIQSIILNGLQPGELYYVRAKVIAEDGIHDDSDYYYAEQLLSTKKLTEVPSLSLTMGVDKLVVRVDSCGANGWSYEVATDDSFTNRIASGSVAQQQLYTVVDDLTPETTYYVRAKIRAEDSEHIDSGWIVVSGTTYSDTSLPLEGSLSFMVTDVGTNDATLSVTGVCDRGAKIELATDSAFNTVIATEVIGTSTTLTVEGLTPDTQYYVRAKNLGDGDYIKDSLWLNGTSPFTTKSLPKVAAPQDLECTPVGTTILVAWTPSTDDIDAYEIQYSKDFNFNSVTTTLATKTITSKLLTGLEKETTYYIRVRARGIAGTTNNSDWVTGSAVTGLAILPKINNTEVENISATSDSMTISWNPVDGATNGYEVEWAINPAYENSDHLYTTDTFATIKPIKPATSYFIRVRALGVDGESDSSDWLEFTVTTPMPSKFTAPSLSGQVSGTDTILTMWDTQAGAYAYTAEVATDSTFMNKVDKVLAENGMVLTNLNEGTTYYIRVRVNATDTMEQSDWSNVFSATTATTPKYKAVEITSSAVAGTVADIVWTTGESRTYEVQCTTEPNFDGKYETVTVTNKETLRMSNLAETSTYLVRLRVKADSLHEASDWVQTIFTTTTIADNPDQPKLAPVTMNECTFTDSSIIASWAPSTDETCIGYIVSITDSNNNTTQYTVTDTSYEFKNLDPATLYIISVKAVGTLGKSLTSEPMVTMVTTKAIPILTPPVVTQTLTTTSLATLTWAPTEGASYYQLEVADDLEFTRNVRTIVDNQNITTATIPELRDNTSYCYRLRAINSKTMSQYTMGQIVTKTLNKQLKFTTITPDVGSCLVEWSKVAGVNEYSLDVTTDSEFTRDVQKLVSREDVGYVLIGNLHSDTTYYVRLMATGQESTTKSFKTLAYSNNDNNTDDSSKSNSDTNSNDTQTTLPVTNNNSNANANTVKPTVEQKGPAYESTVQINTDTPANQTAGNNATDTKTGVNIDTNGDGKPDLNIDTNGDGKPDLNVDTNGDGKPDLNIDTNGDGKPDINIETNGDGIPDLNIDVDGDGKPDINIDTNGDGKPDLNIDTNGDWKADLNVDTNGDGKPDMNIDINGDGKADLSIKSHLFKYLLNIDLDGDGKPDLNIDIDGDGIPDLNIDLDGDGKPDKNIDLDGDGKPDKSKVEKTEKTKTTDTEKIDLDKESLDLSVADITEYTTVTGPTEDQYMPYTNGNVQPSNGTNLQPTYTDGNSNTQPSGNSNTQPVNNGYGNNNVWLEDDDVNPATGVALPLIGISLSVALLSVVALKKRK